MSHYVTLKIRTALITPGGLPHGVAKLSLTTADTDGALVLPTEMEVPLDENGEANPQCWSNASGSQGSQLVVKIYDSAGVRQIRRVGTVPAVDCFLHDILDQQPAPPLSDAQAAELAAQEYAAQAGAVLTDPAFIAVHGDLVNIDAVAGSVASVNAVAADLANINTAAAHAVNIDTVATSAANVDTVAAHVANIDTVAPHVANVDTVAPHVGTIDTLAPHVANVDTLAPHVANIDAVAPHVANIDTLAPHVANIDAVAADTTNIDTVAINIAGVNTAAANIVSIQGAAAAAASASTSASLALAVFGTTADLNAAQQIMLGYANTAGAQAQLAAGFATSASSVVQQDLSGVSAQALHRSPNPITALFLYDTSRDSDGGAWVDRCAHTSWMNEALNGTWLYGPASGFASEIDARDWFGTLGQASLVTGDSSNFAGGVGAWAPYASNSAISSVNGRLRLTLTTALGNVAGASIAITTVIGQRYRVDLTLATPNAGLNTFVQAGTSPGNSSLAAINALSSYGSKTLSFVATGTTTYINVSGSTLWPQNSFAEIDDFTVRPVSYATNPSGAYYQSAADGKCYRLWKNLYRDSTNFASASWVATNVTVTPDAGVAPDGTTTADLMVLNNGSAGGNIVCAGAVVTLVAGVTYTQKLDVKPNGTKTVFTLLSGAALYADGLARSFAYTLSGAGSVALTAGGGVSATGATPGITALANGWYRITLTFTPTVSGNVAMQHRDSVLGDGVNGFYLSQTQVEVGPAWTGDEIKAADASQTETFTGNTGKFPRLAAIVAEASNFTLYDVTQPGRPMWKRFAYAAGGYSGPVLLNSAGLVGAYALNGTCCIADSNATDGRVLSINFAQDKITSQQQSAAFSGVFRGGIASRNVALGWNLGSAAAIGSKIVNAVAMTVLPEAPLDPVTGLQIPTIAAATSAGVSVVKNDGSVVVSSNTGAFQGVKFDDRANLWAHQGTASSSIFAASVKSIGASFALRNYSHLTIPAVWPISAGVNATVAGSGMVARAANANPGLTLLRENEGVNASGLAAYITDKFNTGWMTGDIRRCWLSSNVAEAITATELVTNGTFGADITGWSAGTNAAATWNAGALRATVQANGGAWVHQTAPITCVIGKTYRLSVDIVARALTGNTFIMVGDTLDNNQRGQTLCATTGTFTLTFQATATSHYVAVQSSGLALAGETFDIDNISVKEVDADRSYKAKPLTINGTITKTAVATAAQLMFYGGWSATNYLQEPYSADLDFGTGAWRVGAWVNVPSAVPPVATAGAFPYVTGELVTNGDFGAGATGWSVGGNDATHVATFSGGTLRYQSDTTTPQLAVNTNAAILTSGATYEVTVVTSAWVSGSLKSDQLTDRRTGVQVVFGAAVGTQTFICTAASTGSIAITRATTNVDVTLDSFSVKQIGPSILFERSAATGASIKLGLDAASRFVGTVYDGTTTRTVQSTASYNNGASLKASLEYASSGTLSLAVNGVSVASTTGTPLLTLNNASAVTTIGNSRTLDAAFPGSLALVKPTATLPTAEQKAFMFAQEQFMFQPSAQCCLPDAGAVVDMDYDPVLDRWKAVSAANESSWTGLVRTSSAAVSAGAFTKAAHRSGVKLLARSTTAPGVDVTIPAYGLREELVNRAERAATLARLQQTFDFDAITAQTDFTLPVGYTAIEVLSAGASKREGATKDYTRLFDGFRETIRFAVAPGNAVWVQIVARRAP